MQIYQHMKKRLFLLFVCELLVGLAVMAQPSITEPTKFYVMHSSGNHLKRGNDNGGYLYACPPSVDAYSNPEGREPS